MQTANPDGLEARAQKRLDVRSGAPTAVSVKAVVMGLQNLRNVPRLFAELNLVPHSKP